jgi:hypothetical protein
MVIVLRAQLKKITDLASVRCTDGEQSRLGLSSLTIISKDEKSLTLKENETGLVRHVHDLNFSSDKGIIWGSVAKTFPFLERKMKVGRLSF